jgi:hypothetical protein
MPFAAVLLLAVLAAPKPTGALAPDRVQAAIDFGRTAPDGQLGQYRLAETESWEVNFDTPFLRVAQLAAALRKEGKPLPLDEVPDRLARDEVHVYVHARYREGAQLPSVDHVSVLRPGADKRPELVPARAIDHFVRQVPREPGFYGPARVAHSVRVAFPASALVAGAQLRILFADRSIQTVTVEAAKLAGVR